MYFKIIQQNCVREAETGELLDPREAEVAESQDHPTALQFGRQEGNSISKNKINLKNKLISYGSVSLLLCYFPAKRTYG